MSLELHFGVRSVMRVVKKFGPSRVFLGDSHRKPCSAAAFSESSIALPGSYGTAL